MTKIEHTRGSRFLYYLLSYQVQQVTENSFADYVQQSNSIPALAQSQLVLR
jgi:hypothetical protein